MMSNRVKKDEGRGTKLLVKNLEAALADFLPSRFDKTSDGCIIVAD